MTPNPTPAALDELLRVKPLEWIDHTKGPGCPIRRIAQPFVGCVVWIFQAGEADHWYLSYNSGLNGKFLVKGDEAAARTAAQADFNTRIHSTLEPTPTASVSGEKGEPDFAASIAEVINEESLGGAACGWRSCTGCHETNEGAETGHYPYSKLFGTYVGSGCSECGGLGVVWEYWSKDGLDAMAEAIPTPATVPTQLDGATDAMVGAFFKRLYPFLRPFIDEQAKDEIREALTAALSSQSQAGGEVDWQTIDTAPKDGSAMLAWFGDRVGVRQVIWDEAINSNVGWCVEDNKFGPYSLRGYNDPYPTHWMPLPASPANGEGK